MLKQDGFLCSFANYSIVCLSSCVGVFSEVGGLTIGVGKGGISGRRLYSEETVE